MNFYSSCSSKLRFGYSLDIHGINCAHWDKSDNFFRTLNREKYGNNGILLQFQLHKTHLGKKCQTIEFRGEMSRKIESGRQM